MKYTFFILLISISFAGIAQDEIELHYKLKAIALKKSYKKVAKQLTGGHMDFYLTRDSYRFDVGFKKMNVNNRTIFNSDKDSVAMLQEADESGKIAYIYSFKDVKKKKELSTKKKESSKKEKKKEDKSTFFKTSETKIIKGYTCEKSVSKHNGNITEIWTTNNLKNPNQDKSIIGGTQDVPLRFTTLEKDAGILLVYTLKKVKTKIDQKRKDKVFSLAVPKGFLVKDYEDLQRFINSTK